MKMFRFIEKKYTYYNRGCSSLIVCIECTFVWQKVDFDLEKVFAVCPEPLDELLDVLVRPTVLDISHGGAGEGGLEQVLDRLASFVLVLVQNLQGVGCDGVAGGTLKNTITHYQKPDICFLFQSFSLKNSFEL